MDKNTSNLYAEYKLYGFFYNYSKFGRYLCS